MCYLEVDTSGCFGCFPAGYIAIISALNEEHPL